MAANKPNVVPKDDEWFDLVVDHTTIQSMDVVRAAGYNPEGWNYLGPEFHGKQVYRAKLVRLGYIRNLKDAEQRADGLDFRLLEGQAREPFKAQYPTYDGKGSIIFGGSRWQRPVGYAYVTRLQGLKGVWFSYFRCVDRLFPDCRWLVTSK
jgi:hypothetical protein